MKTSTCILMMGLSSIGLLLSGCVDTPAAPPTSQQAALSPPPPKTCQTDFATGSHYKLKTVCMTEDEERNVEDVKQQFITNNRALTGVNDGTQFSLVHQGH